MEGFCSSLSPLTDREVSDHNHHFLAFLWDNGRGSRSQTYPECFLTRGLTRKKFLFPFCDVLLPILDVYNYDGHLTQGKISPICYRHQHHGTKEPMLFILELWAGPWNNSETWILCVARFLFLKPFLFGHSVYIPKHPDQESFHQIFSFINKATEIHMTLPSQKRSRERNRL